MSPMAYAKSRVFVGTPTALVFDLSLTVVGGSDLAAVALSESKSNFGMKLFFRQLASALHGTYDDTACDQDPACAQHKVIYSTFGSLVVLPPSNGQFKIGFSVSVSGSESASSLCAKFAKPITNAIIAKAAKNIPRGGPTSSEFVNAIRPTSAAASASAERRELPVKKGTAASINVNKAVNKVVIR